MGCGSGAKSPKQEEATAAAEDQARKELAAAEKKRLLEAADAAEEQKKKEEAAAHKKRQEETLLAPAAEEQKSKEKAASVQQFGGKYEVLKGWSQGKAVWTIEQDGASLKITSLPGGPYSPGTGTVKGSVIEGWFPNIPKSLSAQFEGNEGDFKWSDGEHWKRIGGKPEESKEEAEPERCTMELVPSEELQVPSDMNIVVKSLSGSALHVGVCARQTVRVAKARILQQDSFLADKRFALVLKGQMLEDSALLSDAGVEKGTLLFLVLHAAADVISVEKPNPCQDDQDLRKPANAIEDDAILKFAGPNASPDGWTYTDSDPASATCNSWQWGPSQNWVPRGGQQHKPNVTHWKLESTVGLMIDGQIVLDWRDSPGAKAMLQSGDFDIVLHFCSAVALQQFIVIPWHHVHPVKGQLQYKDSSGNWKDSEATGVARQGYGLWHGTNGNAQYWVFGPSEVISKDWRVTKLEGGYHGGFQVTVARPSHKAAAEKKRQEEAADAAPALTTEANLVAEAMPAPEVEVAAETNLSRWHTQTQLMAVSNDGLTVVHKGSGYWDVVRIATPMLPNTGVYSVTVDLRAHGLTVPWGDKAMIGVALEEFPWAARNPMFGPRGYPHSSPSGTFIHSNNGGGSQFGSLGTPSSTFVFAAGPAIMNLDTDRGVLTIYQHEPGHQHEPGPSWAVRGLQGLTLYFAGSLYHESTSLVLCS